MNRPNPKREQGKVDTWNEVHPVGTEVSVQLDNGAKLKTRTIAPASLLGGHTAVLWLEDISGCYKLDRCAAVSSNLLPEGE
jgi:hypothetical protein